DLEANIYCLVPTVDVINRIGVVNAVDYLVNDASHGGKPESPPGGQCRLPESDAVDKEHIEIDPLNNTLMSKPILEKPDLVASASVCRYAGDIDTLSDLKDYLASELLEQDTLLLQQCIELPPCPFCGRNDGCGCSIVCSYCQQIDALCRCFVCP